MSQEIITKFENRKVVLKKELQDKENEMKEFSKRVSECQVSVLEMRGEMKGLEKMLKLLKEK